MYSLAQLQSMRQVAMAERQEALSQGRQEVAAIIADLGRAMDMLAAQLTAEAKARREAAEAGRETCTLCGREVRPGQHPVTFVAGRGWHHDRCAA